MSSVPLVRMTSSRPWVETTCPQSSKMSGRAIGSPPIKKIRFTPIGHRLVDSVEDPTGLQTLASCRTGRDKAMPASEVAEVVDLHPEFLEPLEPAPPAAPSRHAPNRRRSSTCAVLTPNNSWPTTPPALAGLQAADGRHREVRQPPTHRPRGGHHVHASEALKDGSSTT